MMLSQAIATTMITMITKDVTITKIIIMIVAIIRKQ